MTADPSRAILRVRCAMLAAEERRHAVLTLAVWPLLLTVVGAAVCWWRAMP